MNNKEWKYKISGDKTSVVLMILMSAVFGGVTLWLYSTNNGAFIFTGVLTAVMLLILFLTIHRLIFFKVLIGTEGFFYQTNISNGKFYAYKDIEKAWISSGTAQNGGQEQFCNITPYNKAVIRFQFFYKDGEGVEYLVNQANTKYKAEVENSVADKEHYLIDGKAFGKAKIGLGVVILAVVAFIDVILIKAIGFNFIVIASMIMGIATACLLFNDYLFFKVKIDRAGFYCRTNPFNGQYYEYGEIQSCREIKKVVRRNHHAGTRSYYFYFEFTDIRGKTRRFFFEKKIFEHEVNVLKERIEKAKG